MAASNFQECLRRLLISEGGYVNHPSDPGGPTNYGITLAVARRYWKASASAADVKAMPRSVAVTIYDKQYWGSQRCNDLPSGVDYSLFDYGVNSGIGRSGKVLRRLVGLSTETSLVTQDVVDAVRRRDPAELVKAINAERLAFMKSLKTWGTFGAGWSRRVAETNNYSLKLALHPVGVASAAPEMPVTPSAAKAQDKPPPIGSAIVLGGGVATATVATPQTGALAWVLSHPFMSLIVAVSLFFVVAAIVENVLRRHERKETDPMPGTPVVPPQN